MAQFKPAFDRTMKFEGVTLEQIPGDTGGLTFCGISRHAFPMWPGWAIIDQYIEKTDDFRAARHAAIVDSTLLALVEVFYKTVIWNRNKLSDISYQELANQVYDAIVNCGQVAIKNLQGILSTGVDGVMGQLTTDACNSYPNQDDLVDRFLNWRKNYYAKIVQTHPSDEKFMAEWLGRCKKDTGGTA